MKVKRKYIILLNLQGSNMNKNKEKQNEMKVVSKRLTITSLLVPIKVTSPADIFPSLYSY